MVVGGLLMPQAKIGVIGGTGLYDIVVQDDRVEISYNGDGG